MNISVSDHSEHSDKSGTNSSSQVIITDLNVPDNISQLNRTSLPGQEKGLLAVPDASITEKQESDTKLEDMHEDKIDAHIATIHVPSKECLHVSAVSENKFGLFKYAPKWARNILVTPAGILFFLCWASTMQVT